MMLISYVKSRLLVDMQKGAEQHIVHEIDFVFANRSLVGILKVQMGNISLVMLIS